MKSRGDLQMIAQHTPASLSDATSALRALFEAFPTERGGNGSAATYLMAVEGYSLRAIQAAVKRLIRGEAAGHDGRFLPTPAQVSTAVRYCENLYAPPAPRQALPAPERQEPTEEERMAVADRVRQWVKDRTPETATGFKPREPGDIVRELREKQFTLSDAALATFNKDHLDQIAVDDLATEYDNWERENAA
jgi:hypothetical protein